VEAILDRMHESQNQVSFDRSKKQRQNDMGIDRDDDKGRY